MVDDTPDLPLMAAVGFAAAVADAHPLVLSAAHWISTAPGGRGAVRELCDALLRARAGPAHAPEALNAVQNFHRYCGYRAGGQHLDFEFSNRRAAQSIRRRRGGAAGLLSEECRADRL